MLKQLLAHCGVNSDSWKDSFPENFFPIFGDYIVFQSGAEKQSQIYSRYFEVVGLIINELKSRNIYLVQTGDTSDPLVPNALDLRGQLSPRQLGYVIKNSLLCVTSHGFTSRLCRTYGVPLVMLGCNFPNNHETSLIEKCVYIEPDLLGKKWNYRDNDPDRIIDNIKPETVAQGVLNYLGIKKKLPETQFIGRYYGMEVFDFVPDSQFPSHLVGKTITLRLDLHFNEKALIELSNVCKINLVTNRAVDFDGVNAQNVIGITYFCDKVADTRFVANCIDRGAKLNVICTSDENISQVRFSLLGIAEVFRKKEDKSLDKLDFCASMFRSSRLVFGRNKVYPSVYHYKNDIQTNLLASTFPKEVTEDFTEFNDFYYIFKQ